MKLIKFYYSLALPLASWGDAVRENAAMYSVFP